MSNKLLRKIKRAKGQRSQDAIAQRYNRRLKQRCITKQGNGGGIVLGVPFDQSMKREARSAKDRDAVVERIVELAFRG